MAFASTTETLLLAALPFAASLLDFDRYSFPIPLFQSQEVTVFVGEGLLFGGLGDWLLGFFFQVRAIHRGGAFGPQELDRVEVLLELGIWDPLGGLLEDFICKRTWDQLEEDANPDLVGQLDPLAVAVPALKLFPALDGSAYASGSFGSEPFRAGEFLEFD
jgi:hypothetical protein